MRRLIALVLVALSSPALAHAGHDHAEAAREIGWTFAPTVIVPLAAALLLYCVGFAKLSARSTRSHPLLVRRAMLFLSGWIVLAGALVSPLHEAGEVSFTMHMIEHELIMLPAALLLVASRPGPTLLWALPQSLRSALVPPLQWRCWRGLGSPIPATILQAIALVAWHMPALFDRALRSEGWHIAQHLSFVISALFFWWAMLPRHSGNRLVPAMCLFLTSMIGGGLGALMSLAASPWYRGYAALGMTPFGLNPEQDQQLAGVIMWIPGGLFHLAAALYLLAKALNSMDKIVDQRPTNRGQAPQHDDNPRPQLPA